MLKCCICVFALLTWSIAIKWKLPQNGIYEPVATSPISVELACLCRVRLLVSACVYASHYQFTLNRVL